jgi:hypothetical protein
MVVFTFVIARKILRTIRCERNDKDGSEPEEKAGGTTGG